MIPDNHRIHFRFSIRVTALRLVGQVIISPKSPMVPLQVLQIFDANELFGGLHDRLPTQTLSELCDMMLRVLGYRLPLQWSEGFIHFTLRLWYDLWYVEIFGPFSYDANFTLRDSNSFDLVSEADFEHICGELVELIRCGKHGLYHGPIRELTQLYVQTGSRIPRSERSNTSNNKNYFVSQGEC